MMSGEYSLYSKRKGKPGEIEKAVGNHIYDLFAKYGKSYITTNQLSGMILCATEDAIREVRTFNELLK